MTLPRAGVTADLELQDWNRNVRKVIDQTDDLDSAMDRAVDLLNRFEDSINSIDTDLNVEATIDIDDSAFEGFTDIATDVTVNIDDSQVDDVTAEVEDIGALAPEPEILPLDDEVVAVASEVEDIGNTTAEPEIKPDKAGAEEIQSIKDSVTFLAATQAIELVLNVGGTLLDALTKVEELTVGGFLDAEDAAARFEAQTGKSIDSIVDVTGILHDDLGENRDQIARVAIEASQLGVLPENIDEATRASLAFTKVFDDQSPTATLEAINQLYKQGLIQNFQEGADLLTVGFQNGANRGDDLLRTLTEFAPTFKEMGLDGAQSLDIINGLLDAGVPSAQQAARAVSDFQDRVNLAAGDANNDVSTALEQLGIPNPVETGQEVGQDFFDGVLAGIRENPGEGMTQDQLVETFFGKQGKRFTDALIEEQDPAKKLANEDWSGAAAEAGAAFDDSFRGAIDDLWLYIDEQMNNFLSSEQIDLPGKIEAIKTGLQNAFEEIGNGKNLVEALGGALEITLNIPGLSDRILELESTLGNVALSFAELVAKILDFVGQTEAAANVRAGIADLAAGQLGFDVKLADDGAGVEAAIRDAISRGVATEDVAGAIQTAFDESIAQGDLERAQSLANALTDAWEHPAQALTDEIAAQIEGNPTLSAAMTTALGGKAVGEATARELATAFSSGAFQANLPWFLGGDDKTAFEALQAPAAQLNNTVQNRDDLSWVDVEGMQSQLDSIREAERQWAAANEQFTTYTDNLKTQAQEFGTGLLNRFLPQSGGQQTFTDQEALAVTRDGPPTDQLALWQGFMGDIQNVMNPPEFQEGGGFFGRLQTDVADTVASFTTNAPLIRDPLAELGQLAGSTWDSIQTGVTNAANTLSEKAPEISTDNAAIGSSIDALKARIKILKDMADAYDKIADKASEASAATSGNSAAGGSGHALGGRASQGDIVGEAGPEIVGHRMEVLNTATSAALINAFSAIARSQGMMPMGGGSSRNYYDQRTINVSNIPQADMAISGMVADTYRGF